MHINSEILSSSWKIKQLLEKVLELLGKKTKQKKHCFCINISHTNHNKTCGFCFFCVLQLLIKFWDTKSNTQVSKCVTWTCVNVYFKMTPYHCKRGTKTSNICRKKVCQNVVKLLKKAPKKTKLWNYYYYIFIIHFATAAYFR